MTKRLLVKHNCGLKLVYIEAWNKVAHMFQCGAFPNVIMKSPSDV